MLLLSLRTTYFRRVQRCPARAGRVGDAPLHE